MTPSTGLLSTVRGRRLCFEVARRSASGDDVHSAMFRAEQRIEGRRPDLFSSVARGAVGPGGVATPRAVPPLTEALAAVDPATAVGADQLLRALSDTVASAMGWQPPHATDVVLADPEVNALLLPVAEAALDAPAARWWSTPLDRGTQVRTLLDLGSTETHHRNGTARERLRRWRSGVLEQERQFAEHDARHPTTPLSGMWWVTPAHTGLDVTTRALARAGSAALWLTEDSMSWESADLVPCTAAPESRVLEIAGPADWSALVSAYPLDVTTSRRSDWFGAVDARDGAWLIPDWSAVAEEHDAVHVSVLGWLTTSGESVPAGAGASTTLAGWDPDATWWLADVVRRSGAPARWTWDGEAWQPGDGSS